VDQYRFTFKSVRTIADGFESTLAPPTFSVNGEVAPLAPLADWPGAGGRAPSSPGKYLGTGYYHGHAIAGFAVFPLAVEDGSLILLEDLEVEVSTRPATDTGEVVRRQRLRDGFREKVRSELSSLVVNPGLSGSYRLGDVRVEKDKGGFRPTSFPSLEGSPVDYVIITNDDMAGAYQTLADWKTEKGVPTVIRTVEWIAANYRNGSDPQETIRNFIKDAYAKWGVTYVLIGGDTEQVPERLARSCFPTSAGYNLPTDLYYACLDGDWNADHDQWFAEMPGGLCPGNDDLVDLYAEVYVGRLPTRNDADVALLTSKIISYETPRRFLTVSSAASQLRQSTRPGSITMPCSSLGAITKEEGFRLTDGRIGSGRVANDALALMASMMPLAKVSKYASKAKRRISALSLKYS